MKKLLFALLTLLGVMTFTPQAEAGQYAKVWNGHGYSYVHKSQVYRNWPYSHSGTYGKHYRGNSYRHYGYRRPAKSYYYSRPTRVYRSHRYYDRPVRYYQNSRPRFAISFGF